MNTGVPDVPKSPRARRLWGALLGGALVGAAAMAGVAAGA
jgi:hypothetical protein